MISYACLGSLESDRDVVEKRLSELLCMRTGATNCSTVSNLEPDVASMDLKEPFLMAQNLDHCSTHVLVRARTCDDSDRVFCLCLGK